jgi:hypothetical protein
LEGVVRIVPVAQDAATNAEDHRAMTPHQFSKSDFFTPGKEALQKLGVAHSTELLSECETVQVRENAARLNGGHAALLGLGCLSPL